MPIMNFKRIKCPYCMGEFEHTDVHFRAKSWFRVEELDPDGEGATLEEIEFMDDGIKKNDRIQEYHKRENFLVGMNERYANFWKPYAGTSERRKNGSTFNSDVIEEFERPIIDPNNPSQVSTDGKKFDSDGFFTSVVDIFGHETHDRVCKFCCNPLPDNYGKYDTIFIPMIGITRSGKTVYLSSLLDNMHEYTTKFNMTPYANLGHYTFIRDNKIERNRPLPGTTLPTVLTQPIAYNLSYYLNNRRAHLTFVIYDLAGEIFKKPDGMDAEDHYDDFSRYVENANGIIILQPPEQFRAIDEKAKTMLGNVMTRINETLGVSGYCKIPVAMCISKSDVLINAGLFDDELAELLKMPVHSSEGTHRFSAFEYNTISIGLDKFYRDKDSTTRLALKNEFDNFNFFAISSLNCRIADSELTDSDGKKIKMPLENPNPIRIEEPLFWIFSQLGYIETEGEIIKHGIASKIEEMNNEKDKLDASKENVGRFNRSKKLAAIDDKISELDRKITELRNR